MKTLANYVWAQLGRCPYCMRMSFIYAITGIAIAAASSLFLPKIAVALIALCAVALTALWLAHIIVYSFKTLARHNRIRPNESHTPSISRRKMFGTFAKTLATAALATAVPHVVLAGRGRSSKGVVFCCSNNGQTCYSNSDGQCRPKCDYLCI